jgi:hypothetical protein
MLNNYPVANLSKLCGLSVFELNDKKAGSEGFERKKPSKKGLNHILKASVQLMCSILA